MKRISKSTLFKKYIASYILVFSVPFIILLIGLNYVYINNIRDELGIANQNYLEQSNIMLDEHISEVQSVGNYINQMNNFNRLSAYSTEDYKEYQELIQRHEHSANAIENLYVTFSTPSYVFSSRGNMTIDALLDHSVYFSNSAQKNKVRNLLLEPQESLNVLNNRIYYTMPLGRAGQYYGSVLAVMNAQKIRSNLEWLINNNEGMSFLVNGDGEIVLSSSVYSKLNRSLLEDSMESILESDEVKIDGTKYLSSKVTNDLTGWSFISLIDSRQFYRPLYNVVIFVLLGVLVLTTLGIMISYYFAKQNYRPVRNIMDTFDNETNESNESETSESKDEWGYIETNLNKTFTEVKDLNELMDEQAPIIRSALLLDLLDGNYNTIGRIEKRLKEINIHFPFPYFSTIIVELGKHSINSNYVSEIERISNGLDSYSSHELFYFETIIPPLKNNQIVIIVNLKRNRPRVWNKIIQTLNDYLSSQELTTEAVIKMAVGTTYDSWEKIKNAHIEASSALETINQKRVRENKVLFFKDIHVDPRDSKKVIEYPKDGTMLLLQSLKQGNSKMVVETINDIFAKIRTIYSTPIAIQVVTSYVYNAVLEAGNDLGITEHHNVLFDLPNVSDIDQSEEALQRIGEVICSAVNKKKEMETTEIGRNIVEFIFETFNSPDISLEQIASEYNISISYASKLIKEETGESFSNIIQSLRMKLFKEKLLSTTTPIKELVAEVGYYDVSNFTRKFRNENDITPGQYRKKYKDSNPLTDS